jgi:hypothetical protein
MLPFERIASQYFHGTNLEYYTEQVRKHGRYQHDNLMFGHKICIAVNARISEWYARDRSKNRTPMLLVMEGDNVRDRLVEWQGNICLDYIVTGEAELVTLKVCQIDIL